MSTFVNWVIDSFASDEVIDLYFILSDLVDIELSDTEICETAYFDSLATAAVREYSEERGIPLGKLVL